MIPKIIHYCWFGGNPMPEEVRKYISTWKKYCPDYKIQQWNEANFDVTQNAYCYEAYQAKKWAFVADYARLKVLEQFGGIYMDTDIEVCQNLDSFLQYNAFLGFETEGKLQTGVIGSCKNGEWIHNLLSHYASRHFIQEGRMDFTTNVEIISKITKTKYGILLNNTFQVFGDNNAIFPFDYFCAKDMMDGKIKRTKNTYTIHHFAGSWLPWYKRVRHWIKVFWVRLFGAGLVNFLKKYVKA